MAKGNFIEYVISDDPNKYPNESEQDGYYYRKVVVGAVEDVTPEVTAQTPVITQIAENLGVTIATPSGTNKQILQGNNANLQNIKTNAKKEGLYVWKKYRGKPKITAEIIVDFESIPEIYATTYLTVTSSDPLNLPVSELDISSFDGLTITREGSDSYLFVFHGDGTTSENGSKGTFTYDKSKGRITWKPYTAWGFNQGWTFTPVIAQKENEFIDFVVSDSETAYPDGGTQDGYWYDKFEGCKIYAGTITLSGTNTKMKISNPFGDLTKVKAVLAITKATNKSNTVSVLRDYINDISYLTYGYVDGTSGEYITVTDTDITFNSLNGSTPFAAQTYHWEVIGDE